jgi:hypothetical protein
MDFAMFSAKIIDIYRVCIYITVSQVVLNGIKLYIMKHFYLISDSYVVPVNLWSIVGRAFTYNASTIKCTWIFYLNWINWYRIKYFAPFVSGILTLLAMNWFISLLRKQKTYRSFCHIGILEVSFFKIQIVIL